MNVFIRESGKPKILLLPYYFEIGDNFYDYKVCIGTIAQCTSICLHFQ